MLGRGVTKIQNEKKAQPSAEEMSKNNYFPAPEVQPSTTIAASYEYCKVNFKLLPNQGSGGSRIFLGGGANPHLGGAETQFY